MCKPDPAASLTPGDPIRVILLTGTLGAGKTAIGYEIYEQLAAAGLPVGFVDLDPLCECEPAPPDDPYNVSLGITNLAAIWPNYLAAGVCYFIVARVVEHADEPARYRAALPDGRLRIVRVTASSQTRRQRLAQREPEGKWQQRAFARTDELAGILDRVAVEDLTVDNDRRPVAEVAAEVLDRLTW